MSMQGLAGKRVLITGSSRGIGLGIARAFAEAGARLTLLAETETVHEAASSLGAQGLLADIADPHALDTAFAALDGLDILINNAGLELLTPLDGPGEETEAAFRRIVAINVTGTALVTRRALRHLSAGGAIVNTASIWGRVAEPLFDAYVASKHAVIGLTKTWARELGPRGIRVNAVAPGWVRTEASLSSLGRMAARSGMEEQALLDRIVAGQALPGLMEPADIAAAYLFLASPAAANITGQTLGADRGEVPW
jgi:3-hydroxybutyrate dehydrogenase